MKKLILGCCCIFCGLQVFLTSSVLEVMFMYLPNSFFAAKNGMLGSSIVLIAIGIVLVLLSMKDSSK